MLMHDIIGDPLSPTAVTISLMSSMSFGPRHWPRLAKTVGVLGTTMFHEAQLYGENIKPPNRKLCETCYTIY